MTNLLQSYTDKLKQHERDAKEREDWIKRLEEENEKFGAERDAQSNQ